MVPGSPDSHLPAPASRLPLRGLVFGFLTVLCWASAFPAIRIAVRGYSPVEIAFLRALAATLVLGSIGLAQGMALPRFRDLPAFAALGLIGHSLYTAVLSQGQTRVPAAMASFLVASAPVWMVLIGRLTGSPRIPRQALVGMTLSLFGVLLITIGRMGSLTLNVSALIVVGAAILQAIYSLGQRPLFARYSGLEIVTFSVFFALICFLPFGWSAFVRSAQVPPSQLVSAVFLGIVPTSLGYWAWAETNRHLPVEVAGAFLYLVPAVVLILAWLILGERLAFSSLIGGILVVAGVVLVQRRQSPVPQHSSRTTSDPTR
jgi:drug/metabolite transporter (DMT)-like permease